MYIGKWTHTVTHWCPVPLGGPHTLLHKAVVCLPQPFTGSGSCPQATAHSQMVPKSWVRSTDRTECGTHTHTQTTWRSSHPNAPCSGSYKGGLTLGRVETAEFWVLEGNILPRLPGWLAFSGEEVQISGMELLKQPALQDGALCSG